MGSNTDDHRTVLVNEFSKNKSMEHMVEFVQKVYHGSNGLKFDGNKVSVWFDENGMRFARGESSRYARTAQILSWEDATKRIGELIEQGQFATNVELAEAPGYERQKTAERLWYIARDISDEYRDKYLGIVRDLRGGFPDETISAVCWRKSQEKGHYGHKLLKFILDVTLSPIKEDHCFQAYVSEMTRQQLPGRYRRQGGATNAN